MDNREVDALLEFNDYFSSEGDRAAVILGVARLDIVLGQLLKLVLRPCPSRVDELLDGDSPLSTFSAKISCHRLRLIDDGAARALNLIRKIRNENTRRD